MVRGVDCEAPEAAVAAPERRRILGDIRGEQPGPTMLLLAGIHGNEPAGLEACEAVLARLQSEAIPLRGRVVAAIGNLQALAAGVRFVDRDLNRQWLPERLARLEGGDPMEDPEGREQEELVQLFTALEQDSGGKLLCCDLHTSSGDGPPFVCMADTLDNRRLALRIPVPVILGLEECIDGAVMEWFNGRGLCCLALEGGRHLAPESAGNLDAAVWLTLHSAGMVGQAAAQVAAHRDRLTEAAAGIPSVLEVVHRQAIAPEDGFRMAPGFTGFQRIPKGTVLARWRGGEPIHAEKDTVLLLPLYQGQGDDGFFLARVVRPFWLRVAALARGLGLGVCLRALPGVRRDPEDRNSLLVDPRVARWWAVELFHLAGFRRRRNVRGTLRFTRRWSRRSNRGLRPKD